MTVAVLLDACVLYPQRIRDLLLDIALDLEMYRPRWSPEILDEMERNLVSNGVMPRSSGAALRAALNDVFPDAEVTGYEDIIPSVQADPKDRHVLAAAVHGGAEVLVTDNLRDFPQSGLDDVGVRMYSADSFLTRCFDLHPEVGHVATLTYRRYLRRRPELLWDEFVGRLFEIAPNFASRLIEMGAEEPA